MAEAFLSQLLRVENIVQPNSGEPCIICLTVCGTFCPETGSVELEIRLPCNHVVGSRCIVTWLDPRRTASNSCPLCRCVFFPTQPPLCRYFFFPTQSRPYLEHETLEDNQNDRVDSWPIFQPYEPNLHDGLEGMRDSGDDEEADGEGNIEEISEETTPEPFAQETVLRRSARLQGIAPAESIVQVNIPRRSARQQSTTQRAGEEMHEGYDQMGNSTIRPIDPIDFATVQTMCSTYCYRLNLNSQPQAIEISQHLAATIYRICVAAEEYSLPSIAAVAVYMASHLTGAPKTSHWVSMMSGVHDGVISRLYRFVDQAQDPAWLIDEEVLAMVNRGPLETVFGFLPGA
ncbi:hypothetical protein IMSHALPRED_010072 [Imshaugia aleurites]|uniref:RING-type domain-containing protein n=1 Tax=Imshaugia aleurites TaxID=172621 RepID=A0A8H3G2G0_9LECA|nr:hypothetical protein IMSHALPRED_010072 [Imshaugia aleurites]